MIQRIQQKRNEEGFTLIELLIVIIVLGILAAIVVFAVGSTRSDAVASACRTDVKSVELSAEAVNTNLGSYPSATFHAGPNALVAPAPGALLRTWPTSSDYTIQYVGGTPTGSYTINVYKGAVNPTATPAPTAVGCSGL